MLYYDRIDVSEGIDFIRQVNQRNANICHQWDLLDKGFHFQPHVCNGCHDLLMKFMNLSGSAILNINPSQDGYFRDSSRMEGPKWSLYSKFVRHILQ